MKPERIPGTEGIEPNGNGAWFTVSPDERWIAFMEVDSACCDSAGDSGELMRFHMVTLELTSLSKTHHRLRNLPAGILPTDSDPWLEVQNWFSERGWHDGSLFVGIRKRAPRYPWIAFTPGVEEAETVLAPRDVSCCGCASASEWRRLLDSYGLRPGFDENLTVAYRNGEFSCDRYIYPTGRDYRGATIVRLSQDGSTKVVVEEERSLKHANIAELLVSPDEHYLAYTLSTNLKSPIPLPTLRDEIYVLDLRTGKEERVTGSIRLTGNLMWSTDSTRLYYAIVDGAVADGHGDGVYRVDMAQGFR